jgi:hypothetical protein
MSIFGFVSSGHDSADLKPLRERRRADRQVLKTGAMLRGTAGGDSATVVQVFDVSSLGVGFSTRAPLDVGSVYRFHMCNRSKRGRSPAASARAEVRNCRQLPDGVFHIGAQFC